MTAARAGWPTPDDLRDRIERWLPHASGQRHAADNIRPAYHELVDALAADDYHKAVELQTDDE